MPEPGSKAWRDRVAKLAAEEANEPKRLFYMSFADSDGDEGFLGGIIMETHGITLAMIETHALGINPGGEMASWELPEDMQPGPEYRNRLLTRDEIESALGPCASIRELEESANA